jgi:hypothetical protein
MKKALVDEWVRLNPKFVSAEDTVGALLKHSVIETLYGFFAPLLLVKWLIASAWRSLRISR